MSLVIYDFSDNSIDHESDIKDLLLSQYCDSSNLLRLLTSIANIKQEIEHVALDLMSKRSLNNAEGQQLNSLGDLVGLPREGRTDDEYRIEIGIQIQVNLSGGQIEILIGVVATITGSTVVLLTESFPAKIDIAFNGTTSPNLLTVVSQLKAAGVEMSLTQFSANPLVFADDISGLGFSDEGFLNGGEFSEVV